LVVMNTGWEGPGMCFCLIYFQTAKKAFLLNFFSNRDEGFFMGFDLW